MVSPIRNEDILVTGGAGFIGSALVKRLLSDGNKVYVLDNFVTGDLQNLKDIFNNMDADQDELEERLDIISGDLLNTDIEDLLLSNDINYVFHLAAEPFIPSCYDRPGQFFSVNANGTLRLLLACREADIERIVNYSSSEVYGTAQDIPMDEQHRVYPQSTYAVSKLAADRLCFTLFHEQDIPVVVLRQFNCYGPRETHPYIVPELIAQLAESNKLELGNIEASRDLTYVTDAVRGASKLINCEAAEGEVVNLGYGEDFTVEELAHKTASLMGYDDVDIETEASRFRPLDVQQLHCDYTKASNLIDYEPTVSLEEGLRRTIDWYLNEGEWVWETTLEDQLWQE
ncbi:NAD-dependent epimerase/dehydratase family protein [Halomicrobium mukohataei]|uniref:NAD-dependent epimerase/dehydratase family protein n=1 Tax=Halomicrobium mukohataei TaxID=57705 RepID=A0A847TYK7_9EURY|nr:GDP-mannose 4,6-dehydratase [Halomicrobium mukohataei]NLV08383.1 NAD-dependent epimerase/dehydratase family protein [Halomicrobium mukohataei]